MSLKQYFRKAHVKMFSTKNKLKKRLRGFIGIALASLLIISCLSMTAFASMASDIIPNGTNIPDTDIGGATGMESTLIPPMTTPDVDNGTVPQSDISAAPRNSTDMDDGYMTNNVGRVLGGIIAVIVVLSIIALIIALVPKKNRYSSDHERK